jgi:hypothetical protein
MFWPSARLDGVDRRDCVAYFGGVDEARRRPSLACWASVVCSQVLRQVCGFAPLFNSAYITSVPSITEISASGEDVRRMKYAARL